MAKRMGLAERVGMWLWARTDEDWRIVKLVDAVYWRLPAHDRHVLRGIVSNIDCPHSDADGALGAVAMPFAETMVDGIQALHDRWVEVRLIGTARVRSDAAVMYTIAHEFAHVVLRHNQMSLTVANLNALPGQGVYCDADMDALKGWHEDEADPQIWVWGFHDEMAAFLDEFPEAHRPRWYVELTWGGRK